MHPGFDEPSRRDERETVQRLAPPRAGRGPPARAVDGGRMSAASASRRAQLRGARAAPRRLGAAAGPPLRDRPGRLPDHPHAAHGRGPAARDRARARRRAARARARTRRGHPPDDEDRLRGGLQAEGARAHARLPRRPRASSTTATRTLVLGELRRELAAGEADVLRLRTLEVGTPLHRAATTAPPRALRERSSRQPTVHWKLDVPDSYDAFLRSLSKSTRESAKRYPKRLEKRVRRPARRSRSSATSPTASASSPTCAASPRRPTSTGSESRSPRPSSQRRLTTS